MTTPPSKKRFKGFNNESGENGTWSLRLIDPRYQAALGAIAASYEYLESVMPSVLAVLMGTTDTMAAGYVYRSIRNAKARSDLMWKLLQVAPHNARKPEWFDEILRAYDSIRSKRNQYIHGIWSHKDDDGSTFLSVFPEHGVFLGGEFKREPLENLEALVLETEKLTGRVLMESIPHLLALQKEQQERTMADLERRLQQERSSSSDG